LTDKTRGGNQVAAYEYILKEDKLSKLTIYVFQKDTYHFNKIVIYNTVMKKWKDLRWYPIEYIKIMDKFNVEIMWK